MVGAFAELWTMMSVVAYSVAAFALTAVLVDLVRRSAARLRLVDIPNDRSSHTTPTPRG